MQQKQDPRVEHFKLLFEKQTLFDALKSQNYQQGFANNYLAGFQIHDQNDEHYKEIQKVFPKKIDTKDKNQKQNYNKIAKQQFEIFQKEYISKNKQEALCVSAYLSSIVGDAIGVQTTNIKFDKARKQIGNTWYGLSQLPEKNDLKKPIGMISEKGSMSRCVSDSLLSNNLAFNPLDIRMRFILWFNTGYQNGSQISNSFGLDINSPVLKGFQRFFQQGCQPYVSPMAINEKGENQGSLPIYRLAPICIRYVDDILKGEQIAELQSLTTHSGEEVAECCKLITHLVIKLLNYGGKNPQKDIFDQLGNSFKSKNISVQHLAQSKKEEDISIYNSQNNKNPDYDRNWDWKNQDLILSQTRIDQNPQQFGNYVLDACLLALHISYNSKSTLQAIFKAAQLGGEVTCSLVGLICGAMYGLSQEIVDMYNEEIVENDFYSVLVKAIKLYRKQPIETQAKYKTLENDIFIQ